MASFDAICSLGPLPTNTAQRLASIGVEVTIEGLEGNLWVESAEIFEGSEELAIAVSTVLGGTTFWFAGQRTGSAYQIMEFAAGSKLSAMADVDTGEWKLEGAVRPWHADLIALVAHKDDQCHFQILQEFADPYFSAVTAFGRQPKRRWFQKLFGLGKKRSLAP